MTGEMGRRTLLLLAVLVPVLAACAVPGTDAAETESCMDQFAEGVGMNPAAGDEFDEGELKKRIRHACEEMVEAGLGDASSEGEILRSCKRTPRSPATCARRQPTLSMRTASWLSIQLSGAT
jgi:hypothetical protein